MDELATRRSTLCLSALEMLFPLWLTIGSERYLLISLSKAGSAKLAVSRPWLWIFSRNLWHVRTCKAASLLLVSEILIRLLPFWQTVLSLVRLLCTLGIEFRLSRIRIWSDLPPCRTGPVVRTAVSGAAASLVALSWCLLQPPEIYFNEWMRDDTYI